MPLSWNEIKHRAIAFSKEWKGETREAAERQSFWNDFFNVFGIKRRVVASFEEPVKKISDHWGEALRKCRRRLSAQRGRHGLYRRGRDAPGTL